MSWAGVRYCNWYIFFSILLLWWYYLSNTLYIILGSEIGIWYFFMVKEGIKLFILKNSRYIKICCVVVELLFKKIGIWYFFSKIGSYVFNELWKYFKFTILLCSKALSFEILSCWNTRSENYLTEAVFVRTVNKVSPFPGR